MMVIKDVYKLVKTDFEQVNAAIIETLHSRVPLINEVGEHIINSGGKRVRPLLVLLMANALGYQGNDHITLAVVIEFVHTATLLHDDVVDGSLQRRGVKTANNIWNDGASVLVGDYIYSRAFQLLVNTGKLQAYEILARATNILAEGEVMQLANKGKTDLSLEDYMQVITAKTAPLFEAACGFAAVVNNTDQTTLETISSYGLNLGVAFQLIDDALDYSGQSKKLGKNVGDDLAEGKMTYPLIHALQQCDEHERQVICHAIENASQDNLQQILAIVKKTGGIEATQSLARHYLDKALSALMIIENEKYRSALEYLAQFIVERDL